MIISSLGSAATYLPINERFAKAFDYLLSQDLASLSAGRYDIEGDDIYMMVVEDKDLKKPENAFLEVHDEYIDIQIPISAEEGFGWAQRSDCKIVKTAMDEQKDIMFYSDKPTTYVTLTPGQFIIFFPHDAHAPLVGEGKIKKIVLKVRV